MEKRTPGALWLVLVLAACGSGAEYELRTGILTYDGEDMNVGFIAPDRAAAGEPFLVEITTWGTGDCSDPVRVERQPLPKGVRLIPIDRHNVSDICELMPRPNHHEVALTFEEHGTYTLELRGREETGAGPNELMSVYREVTIE